MPKTLLVFPPGWSPVGPYLALPVLKSYLQEVEQYKVDIVDLNVEFYGSVEKVGVEPHPKRVGPAS